VPNYIRARVAGATYFFTVTLADRSSDLLTRQIDVLRSSMRLERTRHPFVIDAIVVLPDHLHAIWTLPPADQDYSGRWARIKTRFSAATPAIEPRSGSRRAKAERGLWQRRFWEHVIRDQRDFEAHVDYIHFNPVKHGHVRRVGEWPYSSFHRYVRAGMYPADWGEAVEPTGEFGERR